MDGLLDKYPSQNGFYWAKEKIRELHRQECQEETTKLLDSVIFNLKSSDDGELIDVPPENDTSYNLIKGGINDQKGLYTGTDHQQAPRSRDTA